MRKLSPAYVVTSIVVAIAGVFTQAQAATKSAGAIVAGSALGSGATVTSTSATGIPSAAPAAPSGTGTSTSSSGSRLTLSNTSATDTRNAQTMDATATTRLSGPSPFTSGGATATTAPGSSSTLPTTGPRAGVVVLGTDETGVTGTTAPVMGNPLVFNGAVGSDLIAENMGQGSGVAIVNNSPTAADYARSSVSLDRVIKSAERDRRKAGRNGQLLYSIAPRTNVDRSSEMPDDGPTPALKGLAMR
jgi:hypothetical protein